ncbi:MAG TPA: alanine dehydrogenase, partial [Deltaproteobacteria bacterium]|nr:alanine dehydrogenase [Deltaproteobacteria bacterium]
TTPYAVQLANKGWKTACKEDHALALGLNTHAGNVTCKGVSEAFGYEFVPPEQIL